MDRILNLFAKLSPAPDDAKRKVAKTQGPGQRARNGLKRENEVGVEMEILHNAVSPVKQC